MSQLELYAWHRLEEVVGFFAAHREAQSLCSGQWLIFPSAALCLATIGDRPQQSYFETGSRFFWVADQPYHVSSESWSHFVPAEVVGPKGEARAIHLFVRPAKARDYLYVGKLSPSYMQVAASTINHGMACFELKSALPSSVWLDLGGLRLGDLNFAAVDTALDRLRHPTTVEDRLGVLERVVHYWHGPIGPDDGMSEFELAGVPMPRPLHWWYCWAGRRSEVMSGQNILFKPRDELHKYWQLAVEDERLNFYIENQGVYRWSTLPGGDDPPVFGRYAITDPWEQENVTLSEHLILVCLFEALVCHAKYGASAMNVQNETFASIVEAIPPLAIGPWRWAETRFFAGNGAFMCARRQDDGTWWCQISAKTEHPLQFLKAHIDDNWLFAAV